jgi:hypothetical protein
MGVPPPPDHLDLIPEPAEIQRRLAVTARTQRLLRRLLGISLCAKRERETAILRSPSTRVEQSEVLNG